MASFTINVTENCFKTPSGHNGTDSALLIFLGVTGYSSAVLLGAARRGEHGRGQ